MVYKSSAWGYFAGEAEGIKKRFFTLFCGIKIITYEICIEKEHYLLQNVSCLKLHTEVE